MIRSLSTASAIFTALVLTGLSASAQQVAGTAGGGVQAGANVQVGGNAAAAAPAADPAAQPAQAGMGLPPAAAPPPPPGNSDHDAVVEHIAIGYMGRASMPVGDLGEQDAPVVGVRYWIDPTVGLDLGLGLWLGGTTHDTTPPAPAATTTVSGPNPSIFILHGGVPLALASAKHFVFEVIPELNFGYGRVSVDPSGTRDTGVHLDLGARAGAEIHFGFMGLPQLSLLGTVGLRFNYDKLTSRVVVPATGAATEDSWGIWSLRTTMGDSPWNIFISNVGAFYYF
jgi:hypothetical protein